MSETEKSLIDFDVIGNFVIIVFIAAIFGMAGYSAYTMG